MSIALSTLGELATAFSERTSFPQQELEAPLNTQTQELLGMISQMISRRNFWRKTTLPATRSITLAKRHHQKHCLDSIPRTIS